MPKKDDESGLYWRCPCCAKLAFPDSFRWADKGKHRPKGSEKDGRRLEFEAAVQTPLSAPGRRGGFSWAWRDMTVDERATLSGIVRRIGNRLYDSVIFEHLADDTVDQEVVDAVAKKYIDAARKELERREQLVADATEQRLQRLK